MTTRIGPTGDVAKVELYNLIRSGRAVGNGWLVSRWIDGGTRRANTLKRFEGDEDAARQYAARWNRVARRRSAFRGEIAQYREHHERVDRKEARALLATAVRTRHLSQPAAAILYDRLERLHRLLSTDANDPRSLQLMRRISHVLTKIGPIARGTARRDPRKRKHQQEMFRASETLTHSGVPRQAELFRPPSPSRVERLARVEAELVYARTEVREWARRDDRLTRDEQAAKDQAHQRLRRLEDEKARLSASRDRGRARRSRRRFRS